MRWSQDSIPGRGAPSSLTWITAIVTLFPLYSAYRPLPTTRVIHVREIMSPPCLRTFQWLPSYSGKARGSERPTGPHDLTLLLLCPYLLPSPHPSLFLSSHTGLLAIPQGSQAPACLRALVLASPSAWLLSRVSVSWLIPFSREQST